MAASIDAISFPVVLPELPSDWEYALLGDLVEERGICYGIVQPGAVFEGGTPVLRVNNIRHGRIDATDVLRVDPSVEAKFQRSRLSGGEVLLTLVGTLGEVAIVPDSMRGWNVARAVGVLSVRKNPGSRWVAICLRSALCQHCMRSWATTTVQATFNLRDVANLPVPLPPARIRGRIAHILGTLDDKIELNRRMNATLEGISRAIFKSWFVDFDPVRQKAAGKQPVGMDAQTAALFPDSFEDSEIGEVPKGWGVGRLSDVAEHPRRAARPGEIPAGTPYIGLEHMPRRCIALSDWGEGDGVESNKFEFQRGEILFGKLRPYFHKVGVAPVDGVCSTDIVVARPMRPEWFGVVLGVMSSDEFVAYTNAASTGTKMPRTNWDDMSRYEAVLPPEHVAEALAALMRAAVDSIAARIHQSRTLAALRDTLLPKLLSGEVRVPEAEGIVEEALA